MVFTATGHLDDVPPTPSLPSTPAPLLWAWIFVRTESMNSTLVWLFHPFFSLHARFPGQLIPQFWFFWFFFLVGAGRGVKYTPAFAEGSAGLPHALARWQEENAGRQELDTTTPNSCAFLLLPGLRPSRKKTARDRIVLSATVPTPTTMPALPLPSPQFRSEHPPCPCARGWAGLGGRCRFSSPGLLGESRCSWDFML